MPPIDLFEHSSRLVAAARGQAPLATAYDGFISSVLDLPLWSVTHPGGVRVPWRIAKEAKESLPLKGVFACPGLYLFGSDKGVPLYWGMTEQTLWKRLRGRYVSSPRSQCQLAADYEQSLVAHGIDGFPDEVRVWYRRITKTGTVRLRHAVAFAQHGIEGIWLTVLPVHDAGVVKGFESQVIAVARAWNESRGYPPLLNDQE